MELTLSLQGERLVVQALVSRPEVAELARTQVEHLIQALARQGLTLSQFQVHVPPASQPAGAAPSPVTGPASGVPRKAPQAGALPVSIGRVGWTSSPEEQGPEEKRVKGVGWERGARDD